MSIQSIAATLTDFELCNAVSSAVEDIVNESGLESSGYHHRLVYLLWGFQGFTEKEGLSAALLAYMDDEIHPVQLAECYDHIGLPEIATVLMGIGEKIPTVKQLKDNEDFSWDELEFLIKKHANVSEGEDLVFTTRYTLQTKLAAHIRGNLADYADLDLKSEPVAENVTSYGNAGYLSSAWLWIFDYACEHDDVIPSLDQLRQFTMHEELQKISSATHTLPLAGQEFSKQVPEAVLMTYHQKNSRFAYQLRVDNTIVQTAVL